VEPVLFISDEDEGVSASTQLTSQQQQPASSTTAGTNSATVYQMQFPQLFIQ